MLDDPARIRKLDPSGTFGIVSSLPEQLEEGLDICRKTGLKYPKDGRLVVVGMGGSAIAGDLVASLGRSKGREVLVIREPFLPGYLRQDDFLVFISYSGETWETLSAHREALRRGSHILTVSSGGELREVSDARGTPHVLIPRGLPPRGALGYLLAPLLTALTAQVPSLKEEARQAIHHLSVKRAEWAPSTPTGKNLAKRIALALQDKTPIIYSTPEYEGVVRRWRNELNEMAKVLAWGGLLPEADHNELVGWMLDDAAPRFTPIILRTPGDPRLNLQIDETVRMMKEKVPVQVLEPSGTTLLSHLLEFVHLGDMVSLYLAIARGVDPMPVVPIDRLKEATRPKEATT